MQKLPKKNPGRPWSLAHKRNAFTVLQLAKRRRARQVPAVVIPEGPVDLVDGLVAYWRLDEAPGEVRFDFSGNDLHLTDNNGVGQTAGRLGNAAEFAWVETDRWLDHEDHPLLRFDTDFTMSMWVFRTGSVYGGDTILNKTGALYFYSHAGADFRPWLDLIDDLGNPITNLLGNEIIEENQWFHIVLYRTGNTFGIVVNAGEPSVVDIGEATLGPNGVFRIGAFEAGYPFTGSIDEVGKWNRTLNSAEIATLYNGGAGLSLEEFYA